MLKPPFGISASGLLVVLADSIAWPIVQGVPQLPEVVVEVTDLEKDYEGSGQW